MQLLNNDLFLQIFIPLVTGLVAWFAHGKYTAAQNLKKGDADINNTMINNVANTLNIYKDMVDDLEKRADEKIKKEQLRAEEAEKKIAILEKKLEECTKNK